MAIKKINKILLLFICILLSIFIFGCDEENDINNNQIEIINNYNIKDVYVDVSTIPNVIEIDNEFDESVIKIIVLYKNNKYKECDFKFDYLDEDNKIKFYIKGNQRIDFTFIEENTKKSFDLSFDVYIIRNDDFLEVKPILFSYFVFAKTKDDEFGNFIYIKSLDEWYKYLQTRTIVNMSNEAVIEFNPQFDSDYFKENVIVLYCFGNGDIKRMLFYGLLDYSYSEYPCTRYIKNNTLNIKLKASKFISNTIPYREEDLLIYDNYTYYGIIEISRSCIYQFDNVNVTME